jgi:hypothetical protein
MVDVGDDAMRSRNFPQKIIRRVITRMRHGAVHEARQDYLRAEVERLYLGPPMQRAPPGRVQNGVGGAKTVAERHYLVSDAFEHRGHQEAHLRLYLVRVRVRVKG